VGIDHCPCFCGYDDRRYCKCSHRGVTTRNPFERFGFPGCGGIDCEKDKGDSPRAFHGFAEVDNITYVVYCSIKEVRLMRTVLSVSLSGEMAAELDALAKATGRNKSDIVKESLSFFLWETKFKQVKGRLVKKAKAAGVVTEEDVFKVVS
jgi:predicted transcriptional regulator